MVASRRIEIEQNFQAFEGLASLMPNHAGEFALLRARRLVHVFPTAVDAMTKGYQRFSDGVFSIQRVIDHPVDLGFISYAGGERDAV